MERDKGATLAEIMKATGWQAHNVRCFISILGKKEKIKSFKSARTANLCTRSSSPASGTTVLN